MSSALVTTDLFRRACGLFATGIAVVTTRAADGTPHGLTINSFCSLSLTPPLVMVAIDRDCGVLSRFEPNGHYAVNILREAQLSLSIRFAQFPEGRFTGIEWREGQTGSPILDGVLAVLDCRIVQVVDTGDHRVLVGEVVDVAIGEGQPLLFFASNYARLK
ncbi:MAG TPA: flavin reductase family protein [Bryobacteraceae bacterium]|nr:flavin reductase family protein [Bryobacteraceae bacterium]